jgi:hypothetical protein
MAAGLSGRGLTLIHPRGTLGFAADMTSGQPIPSEAGNPTFDTPRIDTGNFFSEAMGRFAPPSGYYRLAASVGTVTTGNNAELYVSILKNGVEIMRGASSASQSGISMSSIATTTVQGNDGDYFETRIWSDRTGQVTDAVSCEFNGYGEVT